MEAPQTETPKTQQMPISEATKEVAQKIYTKSGYYPKEVISVTKKDYNWKTAARATPQEGLPVGPLKQNPSAPGAMRTTYGEEFFKKLGKATKLPRNKWKKPTKKFGNDTEYQTLAASLNNELHQGPEAGIVTAPPVKASGAFEGKDRPAMVSATSYKKDYPGHEAKLKARGPHKLNKPLGEVASKTSYRDHFEGMQGPRQAQFNLEEEKGDAGNGDIGVEILRPKMDGNSMYKRAYPGWDPEARAIAEKAPTLKMPAMSGKTSYNQVHTGEQGKRGPEIDHESAARALTGEQSNKGPRAGFSKASHYAENYPGHKANVPAPREHKAAPKIGKVDGRTTHNQAYVGHQPGPLNTDIEGVAAANLQGSQSARRHAKRPKMEGTSHYRTQFPGHEAKVPEQRQWTYQKPAKSMSKMTSYNTQFEDLRQEVGRNAARMAEEARANVPFDPRSQRAAPKIRGETAYNGHFKDPKVKPRRQAERRQPDFWGKRYLETSHQAHFRYDQEHARKAIPGWDRAAEGPLAGNGVRQPERKRRLFKGQTTYNGHFGDRTGPLFAEEHKQQ